jgi:hypothetical protein
MRRPTSHVKGAQLGVELVRLLLPEQRGQLLRPLQVGVEGGAQLELQQAGKVVGENLRSNVSRLIIAFKHFYYFALGRYLLLVGVHKLLELLDPGGEALDPAEDDGPQLALAPGGQAVLERNHPGHMDSWARQL